MSAIKYREFFHKCTYEFSQKRISRVLWSVLNLFICFPKLRMSDSETKRKWIFWSTRRIVFSTIQDLSIFRFLVLSLSTNNVSWPNFYILLLIILWTYLAWFGNWTYLELLSSCTRIHLWSFLIFTLHLEECEKNEQSKKLIFDLWRFFCINCFQSVNKDSGTIWPGRIFLLLAHIRRRI